MENIKDRSSGLRKKQETLTMCLELCCFQLFNLPEINKITNSPHQLNDCLDLKLLNFLKNCTKSATFGIHALNFG